MKNYNLKMYGCMIDSWLPDISDDDRKWIANKLGNLWRKHSEECPDNLRLSIDPKSEEYKKAWSEGCCGFFDEKITNPLTENSFWIGLNYGH